MPHPTSSFYALLLCILSFVLLSAPASAISTPVIEFNPLDATPVAVGANMLYLEDPKHTEDINSILNNPLDWKLIKRASPNFGFTETAYWFKFKINNIGKQQRVFIELPIPFLDNVQFFRTHNKQVRQKYFVGDKFPFHERPISHQNYVLPFDLNPGENNMLLRVSSAGTIEAPLTIWLPEAHARASENDHMIQGVWAGVIGIMAIYNLLLFFSLREISYLYYSTFSFGYLFFKICLKGYGFAYLWPEQLDWNSYAISTFIALCNLSVALLVISFLKLKSNNPFAYKIMSLIAATSAVLLVLTFFVPYSLNVRITSSMTMITCSISIVLGYIALLRGDEDARYYCLAWTATFVGVSISGAAKFGLFPATFWINNAGQIGVMVMVTLLSFALANRINREKELRIDAQASSLEHEKKARVSQEELLQIKIDANDHLETQVQERTQTIQKALSELELVNNRLEVASSTDALTTLFNRGHFESRLNIEFKRAVRHQHELSAIICDIDHFKMVNDNYGHKTGDDCLRHFALILKNKITRSGDLIARYGGEEFIILLVDTPLGNAQYLAQSLCDEIRSTVFEFEDQIINITASFGVSSLTQKQIDNPDLLINHADLALYSAKNNGRDQVRTWQEGTQI